MKFKQIKNNLWLLNLIITAIYWIISHITWMLFNKIGVLPMPIWPAAAIEVLAAFYWGWRIAPALLLGSLLANHISLGGQLIYALTIALTNVAGPLFGAFLLRKLVTVRIEFKNYTTLMLSLTIILGLIPILSATGGIGFQVLLGLMNRNEFLINWSRWAISHSMGIFIFALPVFIMQFIRKYLK